MPLPPAHRTRHTVNTGRTRILLVPLSCTTYRLAEPQTLHDRQRLNRSTGTGENGSARGPWAGQSEARPPSQQTHTHTFLEDRTCLSTQRSNHLTSGNQQMPEQVQAVWNLRRHLVGNQRVCASAGLFGLVYRGLDPKFLISRGYKVPPCHNAHSSSHWRV